MKKRRQLTPTLHQLPRSTHALVVSYLGIRRAIGVIGLLLPIVLDPVGWLVFGIEIQDNFPVSLPEHQGGKARIRPARGPA
jgi:hypothetical protein